MSKGLRRSSESNNTVSSCVPVLRPGPNLNCQKRCPNIWIALMLAWWCPVKLCLKLQVVSHNCRIEPTMQQHLQETCQSAIRYLQYWGVCTCPRIQELAGDDVNQPFRAILAWEIDVQNNVSVKSIRWCQIFRSSFLIEVNEIQRQGYTFDFQEITFCDGNKQERH